MCKTALLAMMPVAEGSRIYVGSRAATKTGKSYSFDTQFALNVTQASFLMSLTSSRICIAKPRTRRKRDAPDALGDSPDPGDGPAGVSPFGFADGMLGGAARTHAGHRGHGGSGNPRHPGGGRKARGDHRGQGRHGSCETSRRADADAYSDGQANSYADASADADADAQTHGYAGTDGYTCTNSYADASADADAQTHGYAGTDGYTCTNGHADAITNGHADAGVRLFQRRRRAVPGRQPRPGKRLRRASCPPGTRWRAKLGLAAGAAAFPSPNGRASPSAELPPAFRNCPSAKSG